MNTSSHKLTQCRVVGADKLPAASGGSELLCAAIERAAAEQTPAARFSVEIRVLGKSSLAATLTTAEGRRLTEQKFAISDSEITRGSLERFAKSLASEVARSGHR